jgi:hypothetical protein
MARGSGKGGKHGQGKHDDKPMDGPNPDHKPFIFNSSMNVRKINEIKV